MGGLGSGRTRKAAVASRGAQRVLAYMDRKHYTYAAMAAVFGIGAAQLRRYLAGERRVPVSLMVTAKNRLGIKVEDWLSAAES